MPFLIQPPAHSLDACNPLLTYFVTDLTPSELRIIDDLHTWGWEVTLRAENDSAYLDALKETYDCIERRRRRVGDHSPRLTLEEVWEREARKMMQRRLYEYDDWGEFDKSETRKEQHAPVPQQTQKEQEVMSQKGHSINRAIDNQTKYMPPLLEDEDDSIPQRASNKSTGKLARTQDDARVREKYGISPEILDQKDGPPHSAFSDSSSDTPDAPFDPFMLATNPGGLIPPTYLKSSTCGRSNLTRERSPRRRIRTTHPKSETSSLQSTTYLSSLIPTQLIKLLPKSSTREENYVKGEKNKKGDKESHKDAKRLHISDPVLVSSTLEYLNPSTETTQASNSTPFTLPLGNVPKSPPHLIPLTEAAARARTSYNTCSIAASDLSNNSSYRSVLSAEEENVSDFQKLLLDTFFKESFGAVKGGGLFRREREKKWKGRNVKGRR